MFIRFEFLFLWLYLFVIVVNDLVYVKIFLWSNFVIIFNYFVYLELMVVFFLKMMSCLDIYRDCK